MYDIIILGIVMSIIFYELTEISPGGLIVPGYIAIYLSQPTKILSTVILSLIVILVERLLSNYMVLYGRRRFGVMVIIGFIVRFILNLGFADVSILSLSLSSSIGYLIPAIIAQDIEKQGFMKTISSMLIVSSLVYFIDVFMVSGVFV